MQQAQTGIVNWRHAGRRKSFHQMDLPDLPNPFAAESDNLKAVGTLLVHVSMIATARVQPAEARSIFMGKQATMKPVDGSASRLCSFSMWQ